jgi:hypothetical protein
MKKTVAAVLGGVLLAPAAAAQEAEPKFYAWLGYGTAKFDQDFAGDTARPGVIQGKAGWRFHRNFSVEAEGAVGVDKDTTYAGQVKVDREYGGFFVGFLPLVPTFEIFGRAGYIDAELESTSLTAASQSSSGAAFGAGAVWYVGPLDVRAEYTRYEVDNTADAYVISLGSRF